MNKRILYVLLLTVLLLAVGLSADEDEKNTSVPDIQLPDSVIAIINLSFETVKPILTYSCYDCHSDQTNKPWYFDLPIINGFLSGHIKEAREKLDFTYGFPFHGKGSQLEILYELRGEVQDKEMPILSYRMMHWGRLIEGDKQDTLFAWIDSTAALLDIYYYPEEPVENESTD